MRRFKMIRKHSLEVLYTKQYAALWNTIKGTSRICKSVCTGPSQISMEIVLLFAQAKGKAVPFHPNKAYRGEGVVPLVLKLDTT
jgi:hypothetical protein